MQPETKHLFFLHLLHAVTAGELSCPSEAAVLLASYAVQVTLACVPSPPTAAAAAAHHTASRAAWGRENVILTARMEYGFYFSPDGAHPDLCLPLPNCSCARQAKYGNYDPHEHVPGFLSSEVILPARITGQANSTPRLWEEKIIQYVTAEAEAASDSTTAVEAAWQPTLLSS